MNEEAKRAVRLEEAEEIARRLKNNTHWKRETDTNRPIWLYRTLSPAF